MASLNSPAHRPCEEWRRPCACPTTAFARRRSAGSSTGHNQKVRARQARDRACTVASLSPWQGLHSGCKPRLIRPSWAGSRRPRGFARRARSFQPRAPTLRLQAASLEAPLFQARHTEPHANSRHATRAHALELDGRVVRHSLESAEPNMKPRQRFSCTARGLGGSHSSEAHLRATARRTPSPATRVPCHKAIVEHQDGTLSQQGDRPDNALSAWAVAGERTAGKSRRPAAGAGDEQRSNPKPERPIPRCAEHLAPHRGQGQPWPTELPP